MNISDYLMTPSGMNLICKLLDQNRKTIRLKTQNVGFTEVFLNDLSPAEKKKPFTVILPLP